MSQVYIYDALRTPRGKARADGGLAEETPQELVSLQVNKLAESHGDAVRDSDALILGCVGQVGDQGGHIALVTKFHAELPDTMSTLTINNYCTSGLTAMGLAAAKIASGQARSALAGGVECMSRVPFMGDRASYYTDATLPDNARFIPVVLAADRLANEEGLSREDLDAVALVSQQRANASEGSATLQRSRIAAGKLTQEECPRGQTTAESLAAMEPAFGSLQDDYADALKGARFTPLHTIAHAPPVCDGAGLAFLGVEGLSDKPRARIVAFAESGGDPAASLTAGFTAMDKALDRAGLTLQDMDRIEFMEAFAVTMAKFMRDRAPDPERVNVSGGHMAKGHPLGASGAILASTLLDSLDDADGRYGLVVASAASGVGTAMIVERLN